MATASTKRSSPRARTTPDLLPPSSAKRHSKSATPKSATKKTKTNTKIAANSLHPVGTVPWGYWAAVETLEGKVYAQVRFTGGSDAFFTSVSRNLLGLPPHWRKCGLRPDRDCQSRSARVGKEHLF